MKRLLLLPMLSLIWTLSGPALAQAQPATAATIDDWTHAHPAATQALVDWIRSYPDAARRVFFWDRDHPLRAQFFIRWMVEHPDQGLDDFTSAHASWPVVNLVLNPYRAGVEAFMAWGRAHPAAARTLAAKPRGLSWIAFGQLAGEWESRLQPGETDAQDADPRTGQ